ncbi:MAG: hypothetical protein WKG07_03620 [Hymenobacter sp.]
MVVTFFYLFRRRVGPAWLLLGLLAGPALAQHRPARTSRPASQNDPRRQAGAVGGQRPGRPPYPRPRAKSKSQLEGERRANLTRIQEAGKVLTRTTQKKQATLGQLTVIKEKLTVKQGQIQHISTQLQGIETNVHQTVRQVLSTQEQLARLKAEYGQLLYLAAKTSSGYNQLLFLFASESFNQFVRRLRYVRQYTEARQRQALRILGTQQQLGQELNGLTKQRKQQKSLLTTQLVESRNLQGLKIEQDEVVQQLSQQEQGLRQELAQRQQAVARLDDLIAQRVREEIARAARAARLAAAAAARRAARAEVSGPPLTRNPEQGTRNQERGIRHRQPRKRRARGNPRRPPRQPAWPSRPKRPCSRPILPATGVGCPGRWPAASWPSTSGGTRTRCCAT